MTKTYDLPEREWYDDHNNLHTFAEWMRETHGWNFTKDNLFHVLEKPWKWNKEWRLAKPTVCFKEVERPSDPLDEALPEGLDLTDHNLCEWCETHVGFVSVEDDGTHSIEWQPTFIDTNSNDLACEDCAGQASNFMETVMGEAQS